MINTIRLTKKQWNTRIKTINNKNLKQYHTTTSLVDEKMNECITMLIDDCIEIDKIKYSKLRELCLTEDFAKNADKYVFEKIKTIKRR